MHHDTTLSFDIYRTDLYGQFFKATSNVGLSPIYNIPIFASEYLNLGHSRFEGINFELRHDVPRGAYWNVALGLTRGYIVSVPAGFYNTAGAVCDPSTGANCTNTYFLPNQNFNGASQSTVPYANGTLQIGYRWSPKKYVDLQPTYFGNNNSYYHPAFFEFDAHASYPIARNFSLLATFRNITGIYGDNYQILSPAGAAPIIGGPVPTNAILFGIPYGPRSVIVTGNFQL
jgi:hypothetical protein